MWRIQLFQLKLKQLVLELSEIIYDSAFKNAGGRYSIHESVKGIGPYAFDTSAVLSDYNGTSAWYIIRDSEVEDWYTILDDYETWSAATLAYEADSSNTVPSPNLLPYTTITVSQLVNDGTEDVVGLNNIKSAYAIRKPIGD